MALPWFPSSAALHWITVPVQALWGHYCLWADAISDCGVFASHSHMLMFLLSVILCRLGRRINVGAEDRQIGKSPFKPPPPFFVALSVLIQVETVDLMLITVFPSSPMQTIDLQGWTVESANMGSEFVTAVIPQLYLLVYFFFPLNKTRPMCQGSQTWSCMSDLYIYKHYQYIRHYGPQVSIKP